MSTVQLPKGTYQNTTQQVDADMRRHPTVSLITAASAAAIAAWWQSPGRIGHTLAALASGHRVDLDELVDDIDASAGELDPLDFEDRAYLEALRDWALIMADPSED